MYFFLSQIHAKIPTKNDKKKVDNTADDIAKILDVLYFFFTNDGGCKLNKNVSKKKKKTKKE